MGATSAWYSIQQSHGIGAVNIGPWTAWPFSGSRQTDPYTVARVISESTIPLGAAEGLAFEASHDSNNKPLRLECDYVVEGRTPLARLWTLTVQYDHQLDAGAITHKHRIPSHTHSRKILRFADGSFSIRLSEVAQPGNWIPLYGTGPFRLVLRMYDTPLTSKSGLIEPTMPTISQGRCGA